MALIPFLVALSLACFAVYLANIAREEMIGLFAAIIAIVSFATSLILAPWTIQAVLLFFVVVIWRKQALN